MNNFEDKVVYQIYIKSFCDSNGDGIGDLNGITSKLDYLKELGVDYLWITPFFNSPQKDNGYDVANYCSVDPMFGTMADAENLIAEADKRNIGIMFDMVFNHTSTEHEWFQKALAGDKKYQDYYIFKDSPKDIPPTNWVSKFGGNAWQYVEKLDKWYLHLFDVTQADLNWDNPEVREELKNVIRFWKKKGIKGFRFDVVNLISKPALFENDDKGDGRRFYTDGPNVHEYIKELVKDTDIADMITVGEMSSTSIDNCIRYSNPAEKELAMVFNFHHLKVDYKDGQKWSLMAPDLTALKELFANWQEQLEAGNGWNATFWDNHDQPRAISRFCNAEKYHKEAGKMLASCIHLMRGTPYIYQGDELGMTNAGYTSINDFVDVESHNYYKILLAEGKTADEALHIINERSRDNGRTPMQWSAEKFAGFSSNKPWLTPCNNYPEINAEKAKQDKDSIFYFYQKLIKLRKEYKLISQGSITFMYREDSRIVAYKRKYQNQEMLVICNFTEENFTLDLPEEFINTDILITNYNDTVKGNSLTMKPYECIALIKH